MSKLVRALVLGAMLAAMNLAGLTAVASAQSSDEPTGNQDARRPPTESQVGESWRHPTSTPVSAAEPSGLSGWLVASLSVLVVALALSGGLAARRAGRRARLGHAA